jgi:hypothetical protein
MLLGDLTVMPLTLVASLFAVVMLRRDLELQSLFIFFLGNVKKTRISTNPTHFPDMRSCASRSSRVNIVRFICDS